MDIWDPISPSITRLFSTTEFLGMLILVLIINRLSCMAEALKDTLSPTIFSIGSENWLSFFLMEKWMETLDLLWLGSVILP
jgi:hypothetical protein